MTDNKRRSTVQDFTEGEGEAGWIVTYADLVTLLLVFFVLLFSISNLDLQRFRQIVNAFRQSFGAPTAVIELVAPDQDRAPETAEQADKAYEVPLEVLNEMENKVREEYDAAVREQLKEELREEVRENVKKEVLDELDQGLLDDVNEFVEKIRQGDNIVVVKERNRITITVEGRVFFESGQAALNPEALPILDEIALIIMKYPDYRVNIKGHTDDQPISTAQFPSNWELSAVRATTVLRRLILVGVNPARLTATGYGDLIPVAPNDTPENRARNRRVEFVLEKEKRTND